ncbi:MAG: hypothetical protein A3K60_07695 [Euryarchaeota archaeon RBG_19FT_COMBO_56_21]|nr:MAG: hypothetical protein A3K60_07695 [Euryarchaeota archaeon RBG_19FT_COMBO_56_21]
MPTPLKPGAMDDDRYDRSKRVPWLDIESISMARVLMVGAGAIGNEVAKDLVLSGFRKITIVDMDHVVGSNLNRCLFFTEDHVNRRAYKSETIAEGLTRLSHEAEPLAVTRRIEDTDRSVFNDHEIVLGCLDNIAARLHVNSHSYAAGKAYIDGGMDGLVGKVMVSFPPSGACLQCGMNKSHAKVAALRFSCTGKDVVFHEPRLAAEITTTSVISAVMVREALKIVSGKTDLLLSNAFYYDGQRNVSEEIEVPLDPGCPVHSRRD